MKKIKSILFNKEFLFTHLSLIFGNALVAYATNAVILKFNLVPAGITGISVIISYISGINSIALIYLVINIPIFILGWKEMSNKFIVTSLIGLAYYIFMLEITKQYSLPISIENDIFLSIFFGGMMAGVGSGLYLRYGGSGGSDILSFVVRKKLGVGLGTTIGAIICFNLLANFILQDIRTSLVSAAYTMVMLFFIGKTQSGFSQRSAVFIISSKSEEISTKLNEKLERSSTLLKTVGSYSKKESHMIYTIINLIELGRLKQAVHDIDPDALVSIFNTREVVGQRFLTWEAEGYAKNKKLKN